MGQENEKGSFFVTLYTDASFNHVAQVATLAWRGKCALGEVRGSCTIDSEDVNHAEMCAIFEGIKHAAQLYPTLEGFFVNSDNLNCVKSFWTFHDKHKVPHVVSGVYNEIKAFLGERWIRTKHVKGHTSGTDIRSYMNRSVDKMTRSKDV